MKNKNGTNVQSPSFWPKNCWLTKITSPRDISHDISATAIMAATCTESSLPRFDVREGWPLKEHVTPNTISVTF